MPTPLREQARSSATVEVADELVPALGVGGDEGRSTAPRSIRRLEHGVGEGDVAPRGGRTWRSQSFVPNSADSTFDGTQ